MAGSVTSGKPFICVYAAGGLMALSGHDAIQMLHGRSVRLKSKCNSPSLVLLHGNGSALALRTWGAARPGHLAIVRR